MKPGSTRSTLPPDTECVTCFAKGSREAWRFYSTCLKNTGLSGMVKNLNMNYAVGQVARPLPFAKGFVWGMANLGFSSACRVKDVRHEVIADMRKMPRGQVAAVIRDEQENILYTL